MKTPSVDRLQGLLIGVLIDAADERSRLQLANLLRREALAVGEISEKEDEELSSWLAMVLRRLEGW